MDENFFAPGPVIKTQGNHKPKTTKKIPQSLIYAKNNEKYHSSEPTLKTSHRNTRPEPAIEIQGNNKRKTTKKNSPSRTHNAKKSSPGETPKKDRQNKKDFKNLKQKHLKQKNIWQKKNPLRREQTKTPNKTFLEKRWTMEKNFSNLRFYGNYESCSDRANAERY